MKNIQDPVLRKGATLTNINSKRYRVTIMSYNENDAAQEKVINLPSACSLKFTVTDGVVVSANDDNINYHKVEFENFTGQCEIEKLIPQSTNGPDYAAGETAKEDDGNASSVALSLKSQRSKQSRILSASVESTESAKFATDGKVHLQSEPEYAASLIKRERINFYDAVNQRKKKTFGFRPQAYLQESSFDDRSKTGISVDSSITHGSIQSGTSSVSIFSNVNPSRLRKMSAFQPLKVEREMSVRCNVSGEPFSSIGMGKKRHTCRYCKDSVSTIYSVIDQTLPVPFKGVRLCQFCHTDVSNGRYRTLRRFYTSLVYLKPLCNALIQTEYEKIKLTLTALNTELDTMLIKQTGNVSVDPQALTRAIGRHLFTNEALNNNVSKSENSSLIESDNVKFRDCLYIGVRALATMLALCHVRQDFRYAQACHVLHNSDTIGMNVNIAASIHAILNLNSSVFQQAQEVGAVISTENIEVTVKAISIAQEQAVRVLFYMSHPSVMTSDTKSLVDVNGMLKTLISLHQSGKAHTHMYQRFAAASIHNLVLMNSQKSDLEDGTLRDLAGMLSCILATSEDMDARVHAVGAMDSILSYNVMTSRQAIMESEDFSFYSFCELLTLGDDVVVETCVSMMAKLVQSQGDFGESYRPGIELSNENSCIKALVALVLPDNHDVSFSDVSLTTVQMIMHLFANMTTSLSNAKDNLYETGNLVNEIDEGLKNLGVERVVEAALYVLKPQSSSRPELTRDELVAEALIRESAGYVLNGIHNCLGLGWKGSPSQQQPSGVHWSSNAVDDSGKATILAGIDESNQEQLPLHKLLEKKFFSLKQIDFILSSDEDMAKIADESGKIPLQVLANNKEYLTRNYLEDGMCAIIERLIEVYPEGIKRQDDRALTPFFVPITDWATFAQRGYQDNIHQQRRRQKLGRFRVKNNVTPQSSEDSNKVILPRIEMPPYVEASLQCLSHIVDFMGYPDDGDTENNLIAKLKNEFDIVQYVANVPNLIKLVFFIDDQTVQNRVLNMSIIQRALFYDDYISESKSNNKWIMELSPARFHIFVEKWLYSFDVARSRYKTQLQDYPIALAKEEMKRKSIVVAMKDLMEAAIEELKEEQSKRSKKKKGFEEEISLDMERYRFMMYFLEYGG